MASYLSLDADLLDGARRLDRNALEALHDRYYPQIYRYAYFRLGDAQMSAQVSAQVFTNLLRVLQKERARNQNLETWMFTQAAVLVDDMIRDPSRHASPSLVAHYANRSQGLEEAEKSRLSGIQLELVQRAISTLSKEAQHYCSMRFTTRRSLGEIADSTGKSIRATRTIQHRALASLGRVFGELD